MSRCAGNLNCTFAAGGMRGRGFKSNFHLQISAAMRCAVAVVLGSCFAAQAAESRRVLLLHSFGREFAPYHAYSANFRSELLRQSSQPVDIYDVSLETARFANGSENEGPFVDYVRALFAQRRLDLVVTIGGPAARFALVHHRDLFSPTPMLIAGVDERHLQDVRLSANETVAAVRNDPAGAIAHLLQVRPATTNVLVVLGSSPLENFWLTEMQYAFQHFTNRVTFRWTHQLRYADMLQAAATLPERSAVFYSMMTTDPEGVTLPEARILADLRARANGPVFGLFDSQLGHGIVGGPLLSLERASAVAAAAGVRILQGESPGDIRIPVQQSGPLTYDYRELQRWGIGSESLLPGSTVLFREPTLWERYRWRITGIVALVLLEALLITALLASLIQRRRAERSLHETEARFQIAADAAPLMIWMSGVDKLSTFFNKPWLEFTGRTLEQELGDGWMEAVHRDDRQCCLKTYVEAFEKRQAFQMQYRLRRHDGNYRWILDSGKPRIDVHGNFAGYIGSCLDITESQRTIEALTESQSRLQAILDTALDGIITVDEAGIIQSINAAASGIFGYDPLEMIGEDVKRFVPAPLRDEKDDYLSSYWQNPEIIGRGREVIGRRKNGALFPMELTVGNILVAQRRAFIGFVRDITERKKAEQAAREFGGRLLHVQEAERARLARELHDDVTQRLARLAIDAGRLERGGLENKLGETLREVCEGLGRLSEDVHSLSYRLHPSILEDLGLAAALRTECERFSRQESIRVEVRLGELPGSISNEAALCLFRISQEALRNIARHARATRAQLNLRVLDDGLQLAIQDDGRGFDPSLKRERLSLGLASMRERIRQISGELDIESSPGNGTTILAWVPLKGNKHEPTSHIAGR